VQAALTGRVAQRGDSLSINVELIAGRDNSLMWVSNKIAGAFAVQEEMSR